MPLLPPKRILGALVMALALGACSGNPEPSPFADGESAVVIVEAGPTLTANMTVYLVPETGNRRRLGVVTSNETERFRVSDISWADRYRLLAVAVDGDELVSNPFGIDPGAAITWDVDVNTIALN